MCVWNECGKNHPCAQQFFNRLWAVGCIIVIYINRVIILTKEAIWNQWILWKYSKVRSYHALFNNCCIQFNVNVRKAGTLLVCMHTTLGTVEWACKKQLMSLLCFKSHFLIPTKLSTSRPPKPSSRPLLHRENGQIRNINPIST